MVPVVDVFAEQHELDSGDSLRLEVSKDRIRWWTTRAPFTREQFDYNYWIGLSHCANRCGENQEEEQTSLHVHLIRGFNIRYIRFQAELSSLHAIEKRASREARHDFCRGLQQLITYSFS